MADELYSVRLTRAAEKDFRDLRGYASRVITLLDELAREPRKGHALAGSLKGVRSLEFSLPGGAYRAAYVVDDEDRICRILAIGSHENFYRLVERRYMAFNRD